MSVSVLGVLLRLRLRASSCRSPRPARRGLKRGAAAATAAIAAASLAMWLHFVYSPARRPPPPPARLPLLLLHRLPPTRALARPLARGWRRRSLGRASCPSVRGAAAETTAPERRRPVRRPGGGSSREPGSCGRPGPGALEPAPLPGAAAGAAAAAAAARLGGGGGGGGAGL